MVAIDRSSGCVGHGPAEDSDQSAAGDGEDWPFVRVVVADALALQGHRWWMPRTVGGGARGMSCGPAADGSAL